MKIFLKNIFAKKIFQEISWYSLSTIILQIFGFFTTLFVSRYLGPINLGLYSFVINFVSIFTILSAGADYYFSFEIIKSQNKIQTLKSYFYHKLRLSVLIAFIGVLFAFFTLPKDVFIFVCIILIPLFLNSFSVFILYAVSQQKAKLVSTIQIFNGIILSFLKIVLVFLKAPLIFFVLVYSLEIITIGIFFGIIFLYHQKMFKEFIMQKSPNIKESFLYYFNVKNSIFAVLLWQILLRADQLILAKVSNAYTVGIYSASVKIAEVSNLLAGIIYITLMSRVANLTKENSIESEKQLTNFFIFYLFVGIFMSTVTILFSNPAVLVIYGKEFAESIQVLRFYALSIPGMYMSYFFFSLLGSQKKYLIQILVFGFSAILNIVLVYYFYNTNLNYVGLASAITYTLSGIIFYLYWKRIIFSPKFLE